MYEARQNKEKVSRRIDSAGGGSMEGQNVQIKKDIFMFQTIQKAPKAKPGSKKAQKESRTTPVETQVDGVKATLLDFFSSRNLTKTQMHMQGEINRNNKLVGGHIQSMVYAFWGRENCTCETNNFKVKMAKVRELFPSYRSRKEKTEIVKSNPHTLFANINNCTELRTEINNGTQDVFNNYQCVTLSNGQHVVSSGDTLYPIE